MESRDGEILGLHTSNNGRTCEQHQCCGKHIGANDLVKFKLTVVEIEAGKCQEAVKAVWIRDGTELCTIGFLGQHIAAVVGKRDKFIGKYAQIIELYDDSENRTMKCKSERNFGIASFRLLDDIQDQE